MPKTRIQKEEIFSKTADRLDRAAGVVFVKVQGVKVNELEAIRDGLFAQGLQLQVAKNSIFKRALKEKGLEVPTELLDQPVGLVFSYDDEIAAAKLVMPFVKDIEAMEVFGGIMNNAFITPAQVKDLSNLPSREMLLGRLVGTLAAPISGLVNVLQGNIRSLVTVMGQIRDAKS